MKSNVRRKLIQLGLLGATLLLMFASRIDAKTLYVNVSNTVPLTPYTNWLTAATNIQHAINVATNGDLVLVNDGVYNSGASIGSGTSTSNRVTVNKRLTIQSVNGPELTTIQGYQVPGTIRGASAIRCVYLTNGATLIGFNLTNGATLSTIDNNGGGVWCQSTFAVVSNCFIGGNEASTWGGGAFSGTFYNCTFISNSSKTHGGGAAQAVLNNCVIVSNNAPFNGGGTYICTNRNCSFLGNSAKDGGGAFFGILNDCTLSSNSASGGGGGANFAALTNCSLIGNYAGGSSGGGGACSSTLNKCDLTGNFSATSGGGTSGTSTLDYCILKNNSATSSGGGVINGNLNHCTLIGNSASFSGGGAFTANPMKNCLVISNTANGGGGLYGCTAYNCTIFGNVATNAGGGIQTGSSYNCIIYYNAAPSGSNYSSGSYNGCCITPLAPASPPNFTNAPRFVNMAGNNFHLQTNSPCINAGSINYLNNAGGTDLDGRPRVGTLDVGAYEYQGSGIGEFIGWLQQFGLAVDGSADYADSDGDGMNNWLEWLSGTTPTNAASVFAVKTLKATSSDTTLSWSTVSNLTYQLQSATNLTAPVWLDLGSPITATTNSVSVTNAIIPDEQRFYRVRLWQ